MSGFFEKNNQSKKKNQRRSSQNNQRTVPNGNNKHSNSNSINRTENSRRINSNNPNYQAGMPRGNFANSNKINNNPSYNNYYTNTNMNGYQQQQNVFSTGEPRKRKLTKEQIKKRRRKRKIQRFVLTISICLFFCCITFLLVKFYQENQKVEVSYQTVERGIVDNSKVSEGIIFRDEVLFAAKSTGDISYIIPEGDTVKKNSEVCSIGEKKILDQAKSQLVDIEDELYQKQEQRQDVSYYRGDIQVLNLEMTDLINDFNSNRINRDPQSILELRAQINKIVSQKTEVFAKDINDRVGSLQSQRSNLQEVIDSNIDIYKAEKNGIVSYVVDDNAEYFSLEEANKITEKQFGTAYSENKNNKKMSLSSDAKEGSPLFKIIENQVWRIVSFVPTEYAERFQEGKEYNLFLSDEQQKAQTFKLVAKQESEKTTKLIFEAYTNISDFASKRTVQFTIDGDKAEGLKIPLEALVERNLIVIPSEYIIKQGQEKGVFKQVENNKVFVPVSVQYEKFIDVNNKELGKNSYLLYDIKDSSGVKANDTIINPLDNSETLIINNIQVVEGVYTINNKMATFKEVSLKIKNDNYGIVLEGESSLKANDQIISNPKYISEDQFLRDMSIQN